MTLVDRSWPVRRRRANQVIGFVFLQTQKTRQKAGVLSCVSGWCIPEINRWCPGEDSNLHEVAPAST